jgi:hypothetical protein
LRYEVERLSERGDDAEVSEQPKEDAG